MKRAWIIGTLTVALAGGLWGLTGCDEEIAHEKKVKVNDGEVKTTETTVKESPQGDIKIEKKTTTEEPGKVQEKTEKTTVPNPNP